MLVNLLKTILAPRPPALPAAPAVQAQAPAAAAPAGMPIDAPATIPDFSTSAQPAPGTPAPQAAGEPAAPPPAAAPAPASPPRPGPGAAQAPRSASVPVGAPKTAEEAPQPADDAARAWAIATQHELRAATLLERVTTPAAASDLSAAGPSEPVRSRPEAA
jgi:hypothetical protein